MADPRTENAPETEAKPSRGLGSYVLWGFVVVMVYVLSSGPVLKFQHVGTSYYGIPGMLTIADRPRFYTALWWLYEHTPCHKPLGMYWHHWRSDQYDAKGEFRPYFSLAP